MVFTFCSSDDPATVVEVVNRQDYKEVKELRDINLFNSVDSLCLHNGVIENGIFDIAKVVTMDSLIYGEF
ncbi:MAG: hypothetical protein SNG38_04745 [Rikenellaceae bacterium]